MPTITKSSFSSDMDQLQCCVLIPTYNNHKTLSQVIDGVLSYTRQVIVVNDGSTDTTAAILKDYPQIHLITLPKNRGKGNALRWGFKKAIELGYEHAITIDSDGQHYPEDLPIFTEALKKADHKRLLLIGSRNLDQEGIPKKSSFGNRFSNFWYWTETGIQLRDTQSGYRLYPIKEMEKINFYSTKFEFEIEAIVKASWNGITVENIPIRVFYDEHDRISHYRPVKDFIRISILNTGLLMVAVFYIKPRDLFRKFKKKGIKKFFLENLLGSKDSPKKKAMSIALGIFIGLSPFWGFHTFLVIFLAFVFRLNKVIAFAFSNISFPPFIPFIVVAGITVGNHILGQEQVFKIEEFTQNFGMLKELKTYVIGSLTLAVLGSVLVGLFSFIVLSLFNKKKLLVDNA